MECAVFEFFHLGDFLTQMEDRLKVMVLLEKVFRELIGSANRNGGDVVDRFGGIELDALSADIAQRINHVALNLKKAEFKNLEKANGAGANNNGIGFDKFVRRGGDGKKVFNSHVAEGLLQRINQSPRRSRQ